MCIRKIIEKEIKENEYLFEQIKDFYIKNRAFVSLKWYISKAVKSKYYFYGLTSMTIICPFISSFFLGVCSDNDTCRILSSIFMGVSAISASLLGMLDVRKKWGIYRNQAEIIKSKLAKYKFYSTEQELLDDLERSMQTTHEEWIKPFDIGENVDSAKGEKQKNADSVKGGKQENASNYK